MHPYLSAFKKTITTASYSKNLMHSYKFFLATRQNDLDRRPLTWFHYSNIPLAIRPTDWYAMESVIIDQEYMSLKEIFKKIPPKIIIDIGANVGLFSIYAFANWPHTKIFSIEASPETYEILKINQRKNSAFSWQIFNFAIFDKEGEVSFDDSGLSLGRHISDTTNSTRIPSKRLDNFISTNLQQDIDISLMKVDIEGAEQAVLESCPDILDRVENLLVEIHPHLCDQTAVINVLREKFSYIYDLTTSGDEHFPLVLATRENLGDKHKFLRDFRQEETRAL